MDNKKLAELTKINHEFNLTINELLRMLESRTTDNTELINIDRIKQRINLLRKTGDGFDLIKKAGEKIYEYKDPILAKNEKEFLNLDVRKKYGDKIKKDEEYVYTLINSIKTHYKKSKSADKEKVWTLVNDLLIYYTEYGVAGGNLGE